MYKIKLLKIPGQNDKNYQKSREFFLLFRPHGNAFIIFPAFLIKMLKKAGKNHYK